MQAQPDEAAFDTVRPGATRGASSADLHFRLRGLSSTPASRRSYSSVP